MSARDSTLYKTARCRYFDDNGRQLSPYCNKREQCRFLHPGDADWDNPRSVNRHRGPAGDHRSNYTSKSLTGPLYKHGTRGKQALPPKRQLSPLVPQSALFKSKIEHDGLDEKLQPRTQLKEDSKIFEKSYESRSYLEVTKPENRRVNKAANITRSRTPPNDRKSLYPESADNLSQSHKSKVYHVEDLPRVAPLEISTLDDVEDNLSLAQDSAFRHSHTDTRIRNLIKRAAKLSTDFFQHTIVYDREDRKLRSYTNISSTVSKVSTSAAATLAPSLAGVIAQHAKCKKTVDSDFKELGEVWTDIFEAFSREVNRNVNVALEDALARLRKEGERVAREVAAEAQSTIKLGSSEKPTTPTNFDRKRMHDLSVNRAPAGDDDLRESKRRRLGTEAESNERRIDSEYEDLKVTIDNMKMKMNEQVAAIDFLKTENSQLRSAVKNKVPFSKPTTTSHTPSTSSSSQRTE